MPETTSIYVQDYSMPTLEKQRAETPAPRSHDVEHGGEVRRTTSTVRRYHVAPKLGNPTPLGMSAFALSVMVISFYNCEAFGVKMPNVAVGVSLFTGGVVQVTVYIYLLHAYMHAYIRT
jgi:hypothetical protein